MAASYDFVQLDVFTQTPLAGNPLAVFTDARGLTDKQMQALSREMNLSEQPSSFPANRGCSVGGHAVELLRGTVTL